MKRTRYFALLSWSVFVISMFFKEQLWGVSSLSILPLWLRLSSLCLSFLIIVIPSRFYSNIKVSTPNNLIIVVLSALVAIYCWNNPIPFDSYGDSTVIRQQIDIEIVNWDNRLITEFLQPYFLNTKCGTATFYEFNNLFTWALDVNGLTALKILQTSLGFVFVLLWLFLCKQLLGNRPSVFWSFALIVPTSSMMLLFSQHIEIYYLSYTAILAWSLLLVQYFKKNKKWVLFILPLAFLILVQTHVTNWLFLPSLTLPYLIELRTRFSHFPSWASPKLLLRLASIGLSVIFIFAYFFIYENYNGPRFFTEASFQDNVFLPLFTNEPPPYDRYNLFSLSHFIDYFNLALMTTGAFLLLIGLTTIPVSSSSSLLLLFQHLAISYAVAFFILNPLLSPASDWDLFSLPFLVLIIYSAIRMSHIRIDRIGRRLLPSTIALSLLGVAIFPVHSTPKLLANRYKLIGQRTFKTYWIGASSTISHGVNLSNDSLELRKAEYISIIDGLKKYAVLGNDSEYAALLLEIGKIDAKQGNLKQALEWLELAEQYQPRLLDNLATLAEVTYLLNDYSRSYAYISKLVEAQYAPFDITLTKAIQVSLAAKEYQAAANYAVTYLNRWPDNKLIKAIEHRLRNGIEVDSILNDLILEESPN